MNGSKKLCFVALGAIKEAPEATPDPFRTVSLGTSVNKEQDAVLISRSDHQDGAVGVPDDRVGDATHKRALYAA
jgi:hypothetical protein